MKPTKTYKTFLVNGIADEQMLADVIYSFNARAINHRDNLYKINKLSWVSNTLATIDELYTKKRDLLLKLFSDKVICIHWKKNMIEKVVFEDEEEYDLIEGDATGKDIVWDKDIYFKLLNYKKVWVEETKYSLFFQVADKTFHCPIDKETIQKSYSNVEISDIGDNIVTNGQEVKELLSLQFCNKVYERFMNTPIEMIGIKNIAVDTTVEVDNIKISPKAEEKIAKKAAKTHKRGYNIPVCQYKKIAVFDTIDIAAATTGIEVDTIISGIENQPMGTVSHIWKYINKSKTKVAQYEYLHTYKNQNDINSQSLEVCGKKISHTNVAPKLKEWKQVSKEEFVWIRVVA